MLFPERCSRKLLGPAMEQEALAGGFWQPGPCRAGPKKSLGRCGRTRFGLGVGSFLARCFRKLSALRLLHGSNVPVRSESGRS